MKLKLLLFPPLPYLRLAKGFRKQVFLYLLAWKACLVSQSLHQIFYFCGLFEIVGFAVIHELFSHSSWYNTKIAWWYVWLKNDIKALRYECFGSKNNSEFHSRPNFTKILPFPYLTSRHKIFNMSNIIKWIFPSHFSARRKIWGNSVKLNMHWSSVICSPRKDSWMNSSQILIWCHKIYGRWYRPMLVSTCVKFTALFFADSLILLSRKFHLSNSFETLAEAIARNWVRWLHIRVVRLNIVYIKKTSALKFRSYIFQFILDNDMGLHLFFFSVAWRGITAS